MKISGSHTIAVEQEKAFFLLQDPKILAQCMPGTDHLERIGADEYSMKMKLAMASFSGLFTGKVKIADAHKPDTFKLLVEGTGKIGFLRGEGVLTLVPQENATEVKYEGDVRVGGTIAAVGQRLIETTAKMMIKKFFEKFSELATAT